MHRGGRGMPRAHKAARSAVCAVLSVALTVSLAACGVKTEPDLSSVPGGLSVPGEQGLPAWYYELTLAYDKGLMATRPEPPLERPAPAPGSDSEPDGYFDAYYCERYAYYRKAMEAYLLATLRLDVYDKQVEDSGLSFIPMPEGKKGEYQRLSVLQLDHLYIYNSPHIERLSEEDIAILERLYEKNGQTGEVTQEALDFAARTYPELIRQYNALTQAPFPEGSQIMQDGISVWDSDSLVVVFLAPYRSDEIGNSIPEDIPLMYQREDWLVAKLPKVRLQMMEKVDMPVTLVTSSSYDHWDITFNDKIWSGLSLYTPDSNRPDRG